MTAVEVYCKPSNKCDWLTSCDWAKFINAEFSVMFDFFQECVDQNIIVNQFTLAVNGVADLWKYYSPNQTKAAIFAERFQNMPLHFTQEKFSMKEFWNRHEFEIEILLKETDLDNEKELFDLVNQHTGEMWTVTFPLNGPFDDYFTLEKHLRHSG